MSVILKKPITFYTLFLSASAEAAAATVAA